MVNGIKIINLCLFYTFFLYLNYSWFIGDKIEAKTHKSFSKIPKYLKESKKNSKKKSSKQVKHKFIKINNKNIDEFQLTGKASYYCKSLHRRRTASGEFHDIHNYTAAHKTFPLGIYVTVRNISNNKIVDVRINDRGPSGRKRIIDLSYAAAKKIDMIKSGTADVEIKLPLVNSNLFKNIKAFFTIQVNSFTDHNKALSLLEKLKPKYKHAHIVHVKRGSKTDYKVRLGHYNSIKEAVEHENAIKKIGYKNAFALVEYRQDS